VKKLAVVPATNCPSPPQHTINCPVDRRIRDFLAGRTQGEDLLHALYDHVLGEPVPERLTALLRR
jgi:hypothetical protein